MQQLKPLEYSILKPLEYSECLTDSPFFRQNLHSHEIALEQTSKKIKEIEQGCRKILGCANMLSQAYRQLAGQLENFQLDCIGTMSEDDQNMINYVRNLANVIGEIEEQRAKTVEETDKLYLSPMHSLMKRVNRVIREERHKYGKESNKFYQALERNLNLKITAVSKTNFREADAQLNMNQRSFCKASLNYVSELQSVQETVRLEFISSISSFVYQWLLFHQIANEIHQQDFGAKYGEVSIKIQKAKENLEVQQTEADELKGKMLCAFMRSTVFPSTGDLTSASQYSSSAVGSVEDDNCSHHLSVVNQQQHEATDARPASAAGSGSSGGGCAASSTSPSTTIKQGYLYMHERSLLPKTISRDVLSRSNWIKYYCVYSKETKIFTLIPATNAIKTDQKGEWIGHTVSFKLKSCTRRASDTIDKRFCFDIVPEERNEVLTLQALSEVDRQQWLETMDGREPVYGSGAGPSVPSLTMLDDNGFEFIRQCIAVIEEKGIREQGVYRNCGVNSKVQKLMQLALDKRKSGPLEQRLNLWDSEWEVKTISSAIKTFLRNLPEPLMTFELHQQFINAAKLHDSTQRVHHIHYWVHKLPEAHRRMLELIVRHLRRVADHQADNLMSVGNLAVCFGPTLLRPREETVAAVLDIKFCNVVVEVMVGNCTQIFEQPPPPHIDPPVPPKPANHSTGSNSNNDSNNAHLISVLPPPLNRPGPLPLPSPSSAAVGATPHHQQLHQPQSTSTATIRHQGGGSRALQQWMTAGPGGGAAQRECRSEMNLAAAETSSHDSLSSVGAASVSSAGDQQHQHQLAQGQPSLAPMVRPISQSNSSVPTSRPKRTPGQYAPLYNPNASENVYSSLSRSTGSSMGAVGEHVSASSSCSPSAGSSQAVHQQQNQLNKSSSGSSPAAIPRIPSAYSHFINPNAPPQAPRRVRTLYPCSAGHETELSFDSGQIITNVYESKEEGWLVGTLNGRTGLIPQNYVTFVDNY